MKFISNLRYASEVHGKIESGSYNLLVFIEDNSNNI